MTQSRKWSLGAVGVIALLLVASWFLLLSPKRSEASGLRTQTTAQESDNQQLLGQLQMLKAQNKELPAEEAKLAVIRQQLPADPAQPDLVRSLTSIAASAGVHLDSVAPGVPEAVAKPGALAVASTVTDTPSGPVLRSIPVAINVHGGYDAAKLFFNKLETLKRVLLVEGFTMTPDKSAPSSDGKDPGAGNGDVVALVQARVFMVTSAPQRTAGSAGTTVQAPVGAPSASPSPSPAAPAAAAAPVPAAATSAAATR